MAVASICLRINSSVLLTFSSANGMDLYKLHCFYFVLTKFFWDYLWNPHLTNSIVRNRDAHLWLRPILQVFALKMEYLLENKLKFCTHLCNFLGLNVRIKKNRTLEIDLVSVALFPGPIAKLFHDFENCSILPFSQSLFIDIFASAYDCGLVSTLDNLKFQKCY